MPFIASWPGQIDSGLVSDGMFSQVDLMATLASLVDVELTEDASPDSRSLLPLLLGKSDEGREYVVQQGAGNQLFGIRKGDWKLIPEADNRPGFIEQKHNARSNPLTTPQVTTGNYLFNLTDDPGETNNLAEKYPKIVNELMTLLEQIRE